MRPILKFIVILFFLFLSLIFIFDEVDAVNYTGPSKGQSTGGIEFFENGLNVDDKSELQEKLEENNQKDTLPNTGEKRNWFLLILGISAILSAYLHIKIEKMR